MDHVTGPLNACSCSNSQKLFSPVNMLHLTIRPNNFDPHGVITRQLPVPCGPLLTQSSNPQVSILHCHPLSFKSLQAIAITITENNPGHHSRLTDLVHNPCPIVYSAQWRR